MLPDFSLSESSHFLQHRPESYWICLLFLLLSERFQGTLVCQLQDWCWYRQ